MQESSPSRSTIRLLFGKVISGFAVVPAFLLLSGFVAFSGASLRGERALESLAPVLLKGDQVAVEAVVKNGRLQERFLALREGTWVEAAATAPGQTVGPVSVVTAERTPLVGAVRRVWLSAGELIEELAAGEHRITRKLSVLGKGPWIRAVTRLEPAGQTSIHQFVDRFKFSGRADWSYSPSVGGFNPDGQ